MVHLIYYSKKMHSESTNKREGQNWIQEKLLKANLNTWGRLISRKMVEVFVSQQQSH